MSMIWFTAIHMHEYVYLSIYYENTSIIRSSKIGKYWQTFVKICQHLFSLSNFLRRHWKLIGCLLVYLVSMFVCGYVGVFGLCVGVFVCRVIVGEKVVPIIIDIGYNTNVHKIITNEGFVWILDKCLNRMT